MKLPPRLTAEPQQVATAVFEGIQMKRDVVYVKPIWRFIMLIIRNIPERIFKFLVIIAVMMLKFWHWLVSSKIRGVRT